MDDDSLFGVVFPHRSKQHTFEIAAAILAVATVAWARKPDFSGTWPLDPATAPAAGGGGGRGGQQADSLSTAKWDGTQKRVYKKS